MVRHLVVAGPGHIDRRRPANNIEHGQIGRDITHKNRRRRAYKGVSMGQAVEARRDVLSPLLPRSLFRINPLSIELLTVEMRSGPFPPAPTFPAPRVGGMGDSLLRTRHGELKSMLQLSSRPRDLATPRALSSLLGPLPLHTHCAEAKTMSR